MGLLIQESWTNESEGYLIGESEVYESFTDNLKMLFSYMQSEYGKCISTYYIALDGKPKKIRWVFEKKIRYEDTDRFYCNTGFFIQHAWISIHEKK